VRLQATGSGSIDDPHFQEQLKDGIPAFGFLRVTSGDELSKRTKFVFFTWVPADTKVLRKARISVHRSFVKEVVREFAVELTYETHSEISQENLLAAVRKAGGADYGSATS